MESFRLRFRAGKVRLRKERKSEKSRCGEKKILGGSFAFVLGGALADELTDGRTDGPMDQRTDKKTDRQIDGRSYGVASSRLKHSSNLYEVSFIVQGVSHQLP